MNVSSDFTKVHLDHRTWHKLFEIVTRATKKHQNGGWQNRLRSWCTTMNEADRSILLSHRSDNPQKLDDMTFIAHAIEQRNVGGWQKHAFDIFAGCHPKFTNLVIQPRFIKCRREKRSAPKAEGNITSMGNTMPHLEMEHVPNTVGKSKGRAPITLDIVRWATDGARRQVGRNEAEWITSNCQLAFQRAINQNKVEEYAELIPRGSFGEGSQIVFGVLNGIYSLLDGWHRCNALIRSNSSLEFQICVLHFDDEEEMRLAYTKIDVGLPRSHSATRKAQNIHIKHSISPSIMLAAYKAAVILASDMQNPDYKTIDPYLRTEAGKLEALNGLNGVGWWKEIKLYGDSIKPTAHRVRTPLFSGAVVAVAVWTFWANKEKATEFWRGIAKDSGLQRGDPRKTLSDRLTSDKDVRLSDKLILCKEAYRRYAVRWCAHSWNAWIENRTITSLSVTDDTPIVIVGSPYTYKRHRDNAKV